MQEAEYYASLPLAQLTAVCWNTQADKENRREVDTFVLVPRPDSSYAIDDQEVSGFIRSAADSTNPVVSQKARDAYASVRIAKWRSYDDWYNSLQERERKVQEKITAKLAAANRSVTSATDVAAAVAVRKET